MSPRVTRSNELQTEKSAYDRGKSHNIQASKQVHCRTELNRYPNPAPVPWNGLQVVHGWGRIASQPSSVVTGDKIIAFLGPLPTSPWALKHLYCD